MRPLSMWLPMYTTRLICGLFFISLLQGCMWIDLKIGTNDVCGKSQSDVEPTGCNTPEAWSGSAVGFKNIVTGEIIPPGSSLMCSGANSKRCNTTLGPGYCGLGSNKRSCINKYDPSSFVCKCECP